MLRPSPRAIVRFGNHANEKDPQRHQSVSRGAAALRLAAALGALLVVSAAISRLGEPSTHRAIGRVLGETPATASAPPLTAPPLLGADNFTSVVDNAPFRDSEQTAWFAALAAVRDVGAEKLASDSVGVATYAALHSQAEVYRGRVVTVAGRVRRVEPVEPADNELGLETLWRVTLEPAGGEVWPITVYTLVEPRSDDSPYDATAVGVFFKKLSYRWSEGVGSTPVVVAERLETPLDGVGGSAAVATAGPPQADARLTTDRVGVLGRDLLEQLGIDLEAFDAVEDRRPLKPSESDAFYAVLSALRQTPAAQLVRLAGVGRGGYVARHGAAEVATARERLEQREVREKNRLGRYSVVPLFGDADRQRGELVVLDAIVRRAIRVEASDSAAAERAGVDHYYELQAFTEDSQNLPVVFVVRDLPAGFPIGDAIRQPARLAGFFFKQWAYRTRKRAAEQPGLDRRQFAPLLLGRAPIPLATPDPTNARPGLAIGLLGTAALIGLVAAMWRLGRRDQAYAATTLSRYRSSEQPLDVERLGSLTSDSPGAEK